MHRRAVFLDRDGVLNETPMREGRPASPRTASEFRLLPGVAEAVGRLKAAGFLVIVVTNQPDIARGKMPIAELEAMHAHLKKEVPVDEIVFCPHSGEEGCACRKPKPGMLTESARRWDIDLSQSFMVGDRGVDMEAGRAAGCRTVLVGDTRPDAGASPDHQAASLIEAVSLLLAEDKA